MAAGALSGTPGVRRAAGTGKGKGIAVARPFETVMFEAAVREIKMQPDGGVRVVMVIPETDSDEGVKLRNGYAYALRVTVEKANYG